MTFTPSWRKISQEQIIPDEVLKKIQSGGRPEIYLRGFVGKEFQQSFPHITALADRYQWDIVFADGDIFKAGVGGQGLYALPARDTVLVWFSTGKQEEEIMARAITDSL